MTYESENVNFPVDPQAPQSDPARESGKIRTISGVIILAITMFVSLALLSFSIFILYRIIFK